MKLVHNAHLLTLCILIWSTATTTAQQEIKPWTFLVYMAADNDLEPYSLMNQKAMELMGSNQFINILIYLCTNKNGHNKKAQKLVVYKGKTVLEESINNVDSGSSDSVVDACAWALQSYPCEQFALILWDHGSGWRQHIPGSSVFWINNLMDEHGDKGICYDDTTQNHITDLALIDALRVVSEKYRDGGKIDILGCDACLMASIEIATGIIPYVNYLVASEETIPGEGWNYTRVLSPFTDNSLSPDAFARQMVIAYEQHYTPLMNDFTLSAINLASLPCLMQNVDDLSLLLLRLLKTSYAQHICKILKISSDNNHCTYFAEPAYIDLDDFYHNLATNVSSLKTSNNKQALLSTIAAGQAYLKESVIAHTEGSELKRARGISIYFPQNNFDSLYLNTYWAQNTSWAVMLRTYLGF